MSGSLMSRCGINCGTCGYAESMNCQGCIMVKQPFHGSCPVKVCCEKKKLAHCGKCAEFPCGQLREYAYDLKNGDDGERLERCRDWWEQNVTALRMERQCLTVPADEAEYNRLYRDLSPGLNVHWHGFGEPPCLVFRAAFDDVAYNRERMQRHELVKGRFQKGRVGFIEESEMELFAGLYRRPYKPDEIQETLLKLIEREGPLNIALMKEMTGLLVKQITPALHKLQQAFILFEDQYDGEWDRAWYRFEEMFPEADTERFSRREALKLVLPRFIYRYVAVTLNNLKDFYQLPEKELKAAAEELRAEGKLAVFEGRYYLTSDLELLRSQEFKPFKKVLALHLNDVLVKCEEHRIKPLYNRKGLDILQYLLIDGKIGGAVLGHYKYGPYILEEVVVNLPEEEALARKDEILEAVYAANGSYALIYRRICDKLTL